jgi:hypothetical protein
MKKNIVAGIALSAVLVLSGCGNTTEASIEDATAAGAAAFTEEYYEQVADTADESTASTENFSSIIEKNLTDAQYNQTPESSNPFAIVNALDPEAQRKIADAMEKENPVADKIDFSRLSDSQRFMANMLIISANSMTPATDDVTVDAKKITQEGNTASVPYESIVIMDEGQEREGNTLALLGTEDLDLVYVDGQWHLDAKPLVEMLEEMAAGEFGEDGGEATEETLSPENTESNSDTPVESADKDVTDSNG